MLIIDIRALGPNVFAHFWLVVLMAVIGWLTSQGYKKFFSTKILKTKESFYRDGGFPSSHCCVLACMFLVLVKEVSNYVIIANFNALSMVIGAFLGAVGIIVSLFIRDSFGSRYTIRLNAIATKKALTSLTKILSSGNIEDLKNSVQIPKLVQSIEKQTEALNTESGHHLYESVGGVLLAFIIDSVFFIPWILSLAILIVYLIISTNLLKKKFLTN